MSLTGNWIETLSLFLSLEEDKPRCPPELRNPFPPLGRKPRPALLLIPGRQAASTSQSESPKEKPKQSVIESKPIGWQRWWSWEGSAEEASPSPKPDPEAAGQLENVGPGEAGGSTGTDGAHPLRGHPTADAGNSGTETGESRPRNARQGGAGVPLEQVRPVHIRPDQIEPVQSRRRIRPRGSGITPPRRGAPEQPLKTPEPACLETQNEYRTGSLGSTAAPSGTSSAGERPREAAAGPLLERVSETAGSSATWKDRLAAPQSSRPATSDSRGSDRWQLPTEALAELLSSKICSGGGSESLSSSVVELNMSAAACPSDPRAYKASCYPAGGDFTTAVAGTFLWLLTGDQKDPSPSPANPAVAVPAGKRPTRREGSPVSVFSPYESSGESAEVSPTPKQR